ncbi:MAG: hypothetical protein JW857_05710 [Bacteroidales bacterium]|nr:hypothetical protein [Bacteroidales bacterium]
MKKSISELYDKIKEVVSTVSILLYVTFSSILYFVEDMRYFFIPLILYSANFLMIIEMFILNFKNPILKTKKNFLWLIIQVTANLLGMVISYLAYKYK